MYNVEKIDKSCDPGLIYFHDDGWLSSLSCFASKQFKPLHSLFFFADMLSACFFLLDGFHVGLLLLLCVVCLLRLCCCFCVL